MSAPSYASEPQVQYLHQVLDQLAKGELEIPDFQRPDRWDDDQRRSLLESVSHGYPIGAVMVWRTTKEMATVRTIGDRQLQHPGGGEARQYLLDGMQRLSTLFAALWAPARGRPEQVSVAPSPRRPARWRLGYHLVNQEWIFLDDIERGEERLVVPGRILLSGVELLRFQRSIKHERVDELIERADEVASAIREYKVAILPLVSESVEEAARTFGLINTEGTKMSDLDLINALTWQEHWSLRARMDAAMERLHSVGWGEFEEKYVLAVIRAALDLDIYDGTAADVSEGLREDPGVLERAIEGLRAAVELLRDDCDVVGLDLLPYSYQAVLLGDVLRSHPGASKSLRVELVRWFWWTTAWATFAGISGRRLAGMVKYLRGLADGKPGKWPKKRTELAPLPTTTMPPGARIRALTMLLYRRGGKGVELRERLAQEGARALVRGIGEGASQRDPGNAFLLTRAEEEAFRRALDRRFRGGCQASLFDEHPIATDPALRERHAISTQAWDALGRGDAEGFIRERRDTLERLEIEFLEGLGRPAGA